MNVREQAEKNYEQYEHDQALGRLVQDSGDEIYCNIGELLQQIPDETLAEKIDLLILEMSDADKREYFIKGFLAASDAE